MGAAEGAWACAAAAASVVGAAEGACASAAVVVAGAALAVGCAAASAFAAWAAAGCSPFQAALTRAPMFTAVPASTPIFWATAAGRAWPAEAAGLPDLRWKSEDFQSPPLVSLTNSGLASGLPRRSRLWFSLPAVVTPLWAEKDLRSWE